MIIEEENPLLSLKIADFNKDFESLQKKMRLLRSAYKTGNITKNPTQNDYQLMKESFLWVEVWDVLALEWVHVNALSGQVHRNFQTTDALKTKISNNRVMLVMALRLTEVDEGKSLNCDDPHQNLNNNLCYYDTVPEDLQPSLTSRRTQKLFIKNVSTKYLPERWTKLYSAHARYRITFLIKKLFRDLSISKTSDLSDPEQLIEYKEDLLIDTLELNYKPTEYENLRNHSFYTTLGFLKSNQTLKPDAKPVGPHYKFREQLIYYKSDIENLYSSFALSMLGFVVRDGQDPKKQFEYQGEKINCLYTLDQTQRIAAVLNEDGKLPMSQYGDWCLFYGLPDGAIQVEGFRVESIAKRLGLEFVPLVSGFENDFKGPVVKKIKAGVMVKSQQDADALKGVCEEKEKEWKEGKEKREDELMWNLWNALLVPLAYKFYQK
jgi:hypothetical protein